MQEIVNLENIQYELIEILEKTTDTDYTMDIEVEDTHYYILDNGIVSHNTVSLMTQTTSGIEPVFLPVYKRNRKVNPNDKEVNISFTDFSGDAWETYLVFHPKFLKWLKINNYNIEEVKLYNETQLDEVIKKSPYYKASSADIDWVAKVKMQGAIQQWIDHSISSTTNLPENATEDMVSKVYETGWKSGCKGLTVYREGSRSGVLVSNKKQKEKIIKTEAPIRPKSLPCNIHHITAKGHDYVVIVGLMDNEPYEVFAFKEKNISISKNIKDAILTKVKRGHYSLEISGNGVLDNVNELFERDEEEALTRMISVSLRHGADIKFIVQQLNKSEGTIVAFSKAISRTLSKYLKGDAEEKLSETKCPLCGDPSGLYKKEGCTYCHSCEFSLCQG